MKLATTAQMQELDRKTIQEIGIPGIVLMENAGRRTVDCMFDAFGPVANRSALIFVGPGNNGGDGLVIARHLHQAGGIPHIFLLVEPEKLSGDARTNLEIAMRMGLTPEILASREAVAGLEGKLARIHLDHPVWAMVDSLFGTGLKREVEGRFLATIDLMNFLRLRYGWPITAVDIPSGIGGDTGCPLGGAVRADLTVTYGLPQPGHFINGQDHCGRVEVVDISIPSSVVREAGLEGEVLQADICRLLPSRPLASHKGKYGHLLILAGSAGKTGAAILAARGALYSGVGLVTLAVPGTLNPVFETALAEAMTVPLDPCPSHITMAGLERITALLAGKTGVVLGPGLGTEEETGHLVRHLYRHVDIPMVVDADGLNLLAGHREIITAPGGTRILTPHPGEMGRLLDCSSKEIQEDRLAAASWLHDSADNLAEIITVLKGAGTVIADTRGRWAINSSGNPGMATGGMGDVLAGLLGSLLAQGFAPWDAARLGVYLHGLSADLLAARQPYGYLATEVAANLSRVLAGPDKTTNVSHPLTPVQAP